MARTELVSPRTRRAFRELSTGTVLREIHGLWQDEGFAPGPLNDEDGERRSLYQSYLDAVDWTDHRQVSRALRAFETTARGVPADLCTGAFERLRGDGYSVDSEGRISGGPTLVVRSEALRGLRNPAAILENLERVDRALGSDDPGQAIGSAKELVEATAKTVLVERGLPVDDGDRLPKLVAKAARALGLHPAAADSPDASDAVKKILGAASSITQGIAELRNGYGTGHGQSSPRPGLSARHARLAVAGARLWCGFVLDTLADPRAPWRTQERVGAPADASASPPRGPEAAAHSRSV